jgi:hypothetical protein
MANMSELLKNPAVRRAAIGVGLAILVPIVARALAPYVRPVARSALKVGVVAVEKGRETFAEVGEIVEDMVAEVREEMRAEREETDAALEELHAEADDNTERPNETKNDIGSA